MESASTCLEALVGLVWFDVGLFMTADRIEGFHSWCGWPSDDRRSASRLQIPCPSIVQPPLLSRNKVRSYRQGDNLRALVAESDWSMLERELLRQQIGL